jgi:hypothetical protein
MSTANKQEWVLLYEDALSETTEKPFLVRSLLTKRAMVERLRLFEGWVGYQHERNELVEAVTNLRVLEAQIRNGVRFRSGSVRLRQAT